MKTHVRFLTMIFIAFTLAFSTIGIQSTPAHASSHIIYVKANAAGANNGSSWANAFPYLQDALAAATSGDQIWVAEGVYYPDEGVGITNDDRDNSFNLENGVEMYGGFAGTETLLSQRNVNANPTILSGDIDTNDVNTDGNHIAETAADIAGSNSYHVVRADAATTSSSILDGFIITAGNADGNIFGYIHGGGLFNWSGSPTLQNITFSGNSASMDNFGYGGGMYNYNAPDPTQITNVVFTGNRAYQGGGMANSLATTIVTDSTFINNTASSLGGGMAGATSGNILTNVSFINNTAGGGGGVFASGDPTFTNVTFTGNTSGAGGGLYHTNGSPILTNVTFNDNTAPLGGGLYAANSSNPTLANATFANNTATSYGGGLYANSSSNVTLIHVTFSGNSSALGGGLRANNSTITLKNTIIADSVSGGDCSLSASGVIGAGSINNLIEGAGAHACGLTHGVDSNIIGSDPKLGPLADNGGFTQTHALLIGSPAIDAGDAAICAAAPVNGADQRGVTRPQGAGCDIGSYEYDTTTPTFADVPVEGFGWAQIEAIYAAGITGGCSTNPLNYCPNQSVTRAQMAVFLLRGIFGSSHTPPSATGTIFADVPSNAFAAAWIEQMVDEGITAGCGGGNFCPNGLVTRAQMAVFLLRAKHGSSYTPPSATGTVFTDVPSNGFAAAWIEQLVAEGITSGCGGGNYCPNQAVTRAQMAVFLQRIFNLPMP